MNFFKYPYGLFVLSIIVFIVGIIIDVITWNQVKHLPMTLVTSFYSFTLLIFSLIHLAIYKKISVEKYFCLLYTSDAADE